jgi:hypothetical protein
MILQSDKIKIDYNIILLILAILYPTALSPGGNIRAIIISIALLLFYILVLGQMAYKKKLIKFEWTLVIFVLWSGFTILFNVEKIENMQIMITMIIPFFVIYNYNLNNFGCIINVVKKKL